MTLALLWRYALAETRRARGTLFLSLLSIIIGVASLSAIRSIVISLEASIAGQTRTILGADLNLSSIQPLDSELALALTEDLRSRGGRFAELTEFYSMARKPGQLVEEGQAPSAGKQNMLIRLRAVEGPYPFYGEINSDPPEGYRELGETPSIVVDPTLLRELGLEVGDELLLGRATFRISAALVASSGSPSSGFGFAPPAYIHQRYLAETDLIRTGSRIRYKRLVAMPEGFDLEGWKDDNFERAVDGHISIKTYRESAASVSRFLRRLGYFLTIVGLITLLLGGLGIASALNVFAQRRLDHAAIYRCLGASSKQVLLIYLLLASTLAAIGSGVGISIGATIPVVLNHVARSMGGDLLPGDLVLAPHGEAIAHGLAAGVVTTMLFSLAPVVRMSRVPPLRVLGRQQPASRWDWRRVLGRILFGLLVFGFIVGLSALETDSMQVALAFTAAVAVAILVLGLVGRIAMVAARYFSRLLPSYHLRQGVANLHRPGNQSIAIITAVGVGMFLIASILIIENSLQEMIAIEDRDELPNLFIIDIQNDQLDRARELVDEAGAERITVAPMIAARLSKLNGETIDRKSVERNANRRSFDDTLRTREYFVSYRAEPIDSETVTAGRFWEGRPDSQEVSISQRLADNLGAELGDTLTLDVQGLPLDARITSFRRIRWQAMRPNAMILLSPGLIESAPKMHVMSLRLPDEEQRYQVQAKLVDELPNLSVIDITESAETVRLILSRLSSILSMLALVTLVAGGVILGGATAASRFARMRESMLLKVLGARRRDLRWILLAEFTVLGALAVSSGWLLAELLNRPVLELIFAAPPVVPYLALFASAAAIVALNLLLALSIAGKASRAKPLELLGE